MAIKLGTAAGESIIGTNGWDTLYGLAGNDTLSGGIGSDILSGGDGNDVLEGGAGEDSLHGGAGADVFKYTKFSDASGDKLVDFSSADTVNFAAIAGAKFIGNAQFNGVAGEIRYYSYPNTLSSSSYTYIAIDSDGDAQGDISMRFVGSINFTETAAGSKILKIAANQTVTGDAGNNNRSGGAGNDTISGLAGNDTLLGGEGHDVLLGGDGNDVLDGGLGVDTLTGGANADIFRFSSPDDFSLPSGYSSYLGSSMLDTITDLVGLGDQIVFTFPGMTYLGDEAFSGVAGQYHHSYQYNYSTSSTMDILEFDFDGDKVADAGIAVLDLTAHHIALEEKVVGSNTLSVAANKNLVGGAGIDQLNGGNGFDTLTGNAGNDTLSGGGSNDTLNGGDGADLLIGGLGADNLTGGLGADVFKYASVAELGNNAYLGGNAYNSDVITDLAVGDKIDLSAIAGLSFVGVGNDFSGIANQVRIYDGYSNTELQIDTNGDKQADYKLILSDNLVIEETAAGSKVFQVAENKLQNGGTGNDTLTGGNGNDTLNGAAGNDSLIGGYGTDTLNGDSGLDTLVGGLGDDTVTGGTGNDVFKFNSLAEIGTGYGDETITDFTAGDKINLAGVDANDLLAGDQAFSFVSTTAFTGTAGELRYQYGSLSGDVDGDSFADFYISLTSYPTLAASDFIL